MKICEVCGQEFNPRRWTQRRCYPCIDADKKGDEPRREDYRIMNEAHEPDFYRIGGKPIKGKTGKIIAENERAARKAGMSYGRLAAMCWRQSWKRSAGMYRRRRADWQSCRAAPETMKQII